MTHPTDAAIAQAFRERLESMYSPLTVREVMKAVEARARELDAEKGGEGLVPGVVSAYCQINGCFMMSDGFNPAWIAPPAQAAESVVVTEAMVDAAAKAIFFEETGYRLLDDDDPAHPGGYTVTYTRYARAALSAAIAAMQAESPK